MRANEIRPPLTPDRCQIGTNTNTRAVDTELGSQRRERAKLEDEIARAGRRLDASKRALDVHAESLRGAVEVGLTIVGADSLVDGEPRGTDGGRSVCRSSTDREPRIRGALVWMKRYVVWLWVRNYAERTVLNRETYLELL